MFWWLCLPAYVYESTNCFPEKRVETTVRAQIYIEYSDINLGLFKANHMTPYQDLNTQQLQG
jgi:hypothetical protein